MKKVLISAINYRCSKETIELINSLKNLDYKPIDILILDNSENDDYQPIKKVFPKVKLLINNNIGVSGGINQALNYAEKNKFDYLLMLDADVELDKDCLKEMVKVALDNPQTAIIGAKSYYFNEKNILQDIARKYNPYKGSLVREIGGVEDKGQFETVREVSYVWGGCLLFDIKKMKDIGRLDERYFLFYDTMDIQIRAQKLGYKVFYAPKAKLWHKVSRSQSSSNYFDYYSVRNRLLLVKKFNTLIQKFIFYIYFLFLVLPFKTIKNLLEKKTSTIKWNFKGLFDAFLGRWGRKIIQ